MVRIEKDHFSTIGSIAGGFVLVSVPSLMAAWRACQKDPLGIGDFRTWLACREMKARRGLAEQGRSPVYSLAELSKLLGISEKRTRTTVNRLVAAGLLEWSDSAIAFPEPPRPPLGLDDCIGGGQGNVAIPRRLLRFLTKGASTASIATALAVLLRCLSRRKSGFLGRGRLKVSWVASVFAVSTPAVKVARRELVALGWIQPEESSQWSMNRFGRVYRIDLGWTAPTSGSIPPRPDSGSRSIPPDLQTGNPSGGARNQEPPDGGTGFSIAKTGEMAQPLQAHVDRAPADLNAELEPVTELPAPTLADVRIEDLRDTGRLLDLHRQAIDRKLVGTSEADRLKVVAAAEHALAIGKRNPMGLFAYLVRKGYWKYLTGADEESANGRIKTFLRGPEPPRAATSMIQPPIRPALSEDARAVGEFRRAFAAAKYPGDPFPVVRRHDPSWTRERWDAALTELGTIRGYHVGIQDL